MWNTCGTHAKRNTRFWALRDLHANFSTVVSLTRHDVTITRFASHSRSPPSPLHPFPLLHPSVPPSARLVSRCPQRPPLAAAWMRGVCHRKLSPRAPRRATQAPAASPRTSTRTSSSARRWAPVRVHFLSLRTFGFPHDARLVARQCTSSRPAEDTHSGPQKKNLWIPALAAVTIRFF